MHTDVSEILFTEEQIHDRVAEIGAAITEDFREKAGDDGIIRISVLRGAAIFVADLAREDVYKRQLPSQRQKPYRRIINHCFTS